MEWVGQFVCFYQQKTPTIGSGLNIMEELIRLYRSAFFDCFRSVGLLATKPVDNGYKCEYDANPVETI
jgi:hypothetical protein